MAVNATLIPNPFTPLAFYPPKLADQLQMSNYVVVAGLSGFAWDWFLSFPEEIKCIYKTGIRGLNYIYFLSRLSTLAYCIEVAVFQTGNVTHCQALAYAAASSYAVAMPTTALLFYFRVRAIWNKSRTISVFFGVLWLGNLGTSILIPFAINGAHIGPTQRCVVTAVRSYISSPLVLNAINDTLIFIAISIRLAGSSSSDNTSRARFMSFVRGDGLPRLSKGLLQGGQLYYFTTIGISIATSAMVLSPSVPPIYRAMVSAPNIAIENAMACRVFRNVKLGFINDGALPASGWDSFQL